MAKKKKQIIVSIVFTLLVIALLLLGYLRTSNLTTKKPRYPFPQHLTYGEDTIFPNQYTREQMDDDVTEFYDYWKGQYLAHAGENEEGDTLLRIASGQTGSAEYNLTVSEGQGYGMIIVAIMAGYDPEAKEIFDGLWQFAQEYPSNIDPMLMAWQTPDPEHKTNSAFDGDADIAYALLLADGQWGSNQEIDYASEAKALISAIYKSTIGPQSKLPMLGDWVEANGSEYNQYTNRTSDFMLANFQAFSRLMPNEDWKQVIDQSVVVAESLQEKHSSSTGLLPDFIITSTSDSNDAPKPVDSYFLEGGK